MYRVFDLENVRGGGHQGSKMTRWVCTPKHQRLHGPNMFPYTTHVGSRYPLDTSSPLAVCIGRVEGRFYVKNGRFCSIPGKMLNQNGDSFVVAFFRFFDVAG